jgi:WXG100 family type VII secretion target
VAAAESGEIKLDYPLMEEMKKQFAEGRNTLEDTKTTVKDISDKLDAGALKGEAGDQFCDILSVKLAGAIDTIIKKFDEIEKDIQAAVDAMKAAEQKTQQGMNQKGF